MRFCANGCIRLCASLVIVAGFLIGAAVTPALAFSPSNGGCMTEQFFELEHGKREDRPSISKDPDACPMEGVCDQPSVRDQYAVDSLEEIIYVRLYFHIFDTDDGDNPTTTPEDVAAQVDQLNADYLPHKIQFVYDYRTVKDSDFRWITSSSEFNQMKNQYAVDPENQMNIYVVNVNVAPTGVYSYATFPWSGSQLTNFGGVVLSEQQFYPEDDHTLTHEIGHCFGLWHTFHGVDEVSSCGSCYETPITTEGDVRGDMCADTRPTPLNYSCNEPSESDPCSGEPWAPTPIANYMGYSSDPCQNEFTPQQAARMNCWLRDAVVTWTIPMFVSANNAFGPAPLTVEFEGQSPRQVTQWTWDFDDGDVSFGVEDPIHVYEDPGVFQPEIEILTPEGTYMQNLDPAVYAYADTMWIDTVEGQVGQVEVVVNLHNYLPLNKILVVLRWDGPLDVDLAGTPTTTGLRSASMTKSLLNALEVPFEALAFQLSAESGADPLAPGSGPILRIPFQVNDGGPGSVHPIGFHAYGAYSNKLTVPVGEYQPVLHDGEIVFPATCCIGSVGNVDGSLDDAVSLGDLTVMIDHLFVSFDDVPCPPEADVDLSGAPLAENDDITLGDLTVLIDHLFVSFEDLPPCP